MRTPRQSLTNRVPPHVFFLVSAVFHYLGPAFAVLLFQQVDVLGVAWLRIATAAAVFALWRRPWRMFLAQSWRLRGLLIAFGLVLGLMNISFYEAISRLPLGTVSAIEFIGPIVLAALAARTLRNTAALVLAAGGGWMLTGIRLQGAALGFLFAFANCVLFMLYVVLGHRVARNGAVPGIDGLAAAMLVAMLAVTPVTLSHALPAFHQLDLVLAGIGVGICSSVIPYITDQLAMARLSRGTFSLLLSMLPAMATLIGVLVLHQMPTATEVAGMLLVAGGVALHQELEVPQNGHPRARAEEHPVASD